MLLEEVLFLGRSLLDLTLVSPVQLGPIQILLLLDLANLLLPRVNALVYQALVEGCAIDGDPQDIDGILHTDADLGLAEAPDHAGPALWRHHAIVKLLVRLVELVLVDVATWGLLSLFDILFED